MSSVLRLGVYRERIERYNVHGATPAPAAVPISAGAASSSESSEPRRHHHQHRDPPAAAVPAQPGPGERHLSARQKAEGQQPAGKSSKSGMSRPPPPPTKPQTTAATNPGEELLTVTLERQPPGTQLGIRLGDQCSEAGVFITDIQEGGAVAADGRLVPMDRLLFINGQDVRHCGVEQALALIQVQGVAI